MCFTHSFFHFAILRTLSIINTLLKYLFKPRQRRLTVRMLPTSSVLSAF
ncbi:Uncharacterised protein [Streptococcus pneumoniae]|nr:Uncharacterised protein [Streptococcus pneumoniae]